MYHIELIRQVIDATRGLGPMPDEGRSSVEVVMDALVHGLGAPAAVLWIRSEGASWRPGHRLATTERAEAALDAQLADAGQSLPSRLRSLTRGEAAQGRSLITEGTGPTGIPGARSAVAARIGAAPDLVGVLEIFLEEDPVDDVTVMAVETVAALLEERIEQERALEAACRERDRLAAEFVKRRQRDALTGLPDRVSLRERLEQERLTRGDDDSPLLLGVLDLEGFERVNHRFGADGGDALLVAVADRLRRRVHHTVLARLAGDDFAVLLAGADAEGWDAETLARGITAAFEDPFEIHGASLRLDVAVGVAGSDPGVESAPALLRDAEIALRIAKEPSSAPYQVFRREMHTETLERISFEADLRWAVEHGDIEVAYQPIVDLGTGTMRGVEALARWHRPGHGPVGAGAFIPVAEEQGLIDALGSQVLLTACGQVREWQERHAAARDLRLGVNVAAAELDEPELVATVDEALLRSGLAPEDLVVEITESTVARDAPAALARLWELRARGITIAVDDFGTGYSSLARLRDLPVDQLKIDRSFLGGISDHAADTSFLGALFAVARRLGLEVVAEGVETTAQLAAVLHHECEAAQGHLLARALTPDGLSRLLEDPTWDTRAMIAADRDLELAADGRLTTLLGELSRVETRPPGAFGELLLRLSELSGLESVYLTRIDWQRHRQVVLCACNRGSLRVPEGLETAWTRTLASQALTRNLVRLSDREHPEVMAEVVPRAGIRSYVGVPVTTRSGLVSGALCGASLGPGRVPDEVVVVFETVAQVLGEALPAPRPDMV